jgi:hypothetical protein
MKNENTNVGRSYKTAIKNEYFFHKVALRKPRAFLSVAQISKKYSPTKPDIGVRKFSSLKRFLMRGEVLSVGQQILHSLPYSERVDFLKEINGIREALSWGREWEETLIAYTMTGILCPPIFNLYIEKKEVRMPPSEGWGKLRVSLILNPDTSLDDIENAWPEIEEAKRSLWPNFKSFNLSKNSSKHLNEQIEMIREKLIPISDKEKYGALSEWEESMLKRGEPIKAVLQYRAKRKSQGLSSGKSVRVKNKRTNIGIVKKTQNIKSPKKARKAANLFSQHTRRLLKG